MNKYLSLDVQQVIRQIDTMMADLPELQDDDELRAGMFEGETDFNRIMSRLIRARNEKLALAEGLGGYMGDLAERKARLTHAADGIKALALSLMSSADLPKLVLPEATLSVTKPRAGVEITDLAALPQGTFTLSRQPDKAAIKALLDAGDDVPGATLKSGDAGLTVRTK